MKKLRVIIISILIISLNSTAQQPGFSLNDQEYFESGGVNVMAYQDIYPEGHQGGVGIIMHGMRIVTNGDLRLDETPGQWQPIPKQKKRTVDSAGNMITVTLTFPDSAINRKGFNPIIYPDLYFNYTVKTRAEGGSIVITVDLDRPMPAEFIGKVGFNMELFPGWLFGKSWNMDGQSGIFPRQANGPGMFDQKGELVAAKPMATGKKLVVAPEDDRLRLTIESKTGDLQLIDGRYLHNNGWFVVRSLVGSGVTKNAVEWIITPNVIPGWIGDPVIHVSQAGYHPAQPKYAFIELDKNDTKRDNIELLMIGADGSHKVMFSEEPAEAVKFLRYNYLKLDFSKAKDPGMYMIRYGKQQSQPFRIANNVFERNIWQPVLEYFLPVQMCHMRVNEKYRVWHGLCHMDDARMAPLNYNHFDGYIQGGSTLTRYQPGEHVPGLNIGGWHDAGDYDLRVESQSGELTTAAHMAAASGALKGFNDTLGIQCLDLAEAIFNLDRQITGRGASSKIHAAIELFMTTGNQVYKDYIIQNESVIIKDIRSLGWLIGRALPKLNDEAFTASVRNAASTFSSEIVKQGAQTPFGVPYRPNIWGAGWDIQSFGVRQYFLHRAFPDLFPADYIYNALNFILGVHPGSNTSSFASGVGARSTTVAYGINRADWSYIPGGVSSGTALIRPDFPELLDWPFLWQQQEYVMGGGATNFMFLVLAADQLLNE